MYGKVALMALTVVLGSHSGQAQSLSCPTDRTIVELSGVGDETELARQRACFVRSVTTPNTIVRLGPHAVFDFSNDHRSSSFPIVLGSCVAIVGVRKLSGSAPCPETLPDGLPAAANEAATAPRDAELEVDVSAVAARAQGPGGTDVAFVGAAAEIWGSLGPA